MQTERLYYKYPDKALFNTIVMELIDGDDLPKNINPEGKYFGVILNRTLFYPGGGGQPADRGVLESPQTGGVTAELLSVYLDEARDELIHVVDRMLEKGSILKGRIDNAYRFDFMQQHSAQHIISAVLYRKFKINTQSIHLGNKLSTIDCETAPLSDFHQTLLEKEIASIVSQALRIHCFEADSDLVDSIDLRKKPATGLKEVYLCSLGQFDTVPCCGVHCHSTAETGPIYLLSMTKTSKGSRIEFIAGERSHSLFKGQQGVLKQLSSQISATPDDLPALIRSMIEKKHRASEDRLQLLKKTAHILVDQFISHKLFYINLGKESNHIVQQLADIMAKELSIQKHDGLLLWQEDQFHRFILLDFSQNINDINLMKFLSSHQGNGGGKSPRYQGSISIEFTDKLIEFCQKGANNG